jgi:hypothetical protein
MSFLIDEPYYVYDYMANMMLSFETTKIDPSTIFKYIDRLTVKFGDVSLLDLSGDQLEMVMKLRPNEYRQMIKHDNRYVIPIQQLLMNDDPIVFKYPIRISIRFTNELPVSSGLITFEGFRSYAESYNRNQLVSDEKSIYTYYFNEYTDKSEYLIDLPVDVAIYMALVKVKSSVDNISIKLGDHELVPTTNPYFEYHDILIPIDNTYCYISRPKSMVNLPSLTCMAGLLFGSSEIKLHIASDKPVTVEVMFIVRNSVMSDGDRKTSVMIPATFKELFHEPQKGSPLYKINDTEFIEGYWANLSPMYDTDNTRRKYNLPLTTDGSVDGEFLAKLRSVMDSHEPKAYFGYSTCRVCGQSNGSKEFNVSSDDITFTFPDGIYHYYADHGVMPSDEFYGFIMKLN